MFPFLRSTVTEYLELAYYIPALVMPLLRRTLPLSELRINSLFLGAYVAKCRVPFVTY